jgi:hypothetical protein
MTTKIINKNFVFPHDNPGQLRAVFGSVKEAVIKGQRYCAVPYSLDTARVLTNIGLKAPSPIRTDYDWPGRFKPRWHQVDTAEFFTLNPRSHCHSGMRVGKTLAALWAADYLRKQKKIKRTLIVAPLSTLWDVWESEIFQSFPLRTFVVLHGSVDYRKRMLRQPCDFYIVNHHGVKLLENDLAKREDINHVIIDEIHKFRNGFGRGKGKTLFQPLDRVINKQNIPRTVWGLTGTPTPNAPTDALAQAKLIRPEVYHGSFTSYKNETMWHVGTWKWVAKKTAEQSIARILTPSIRFERSVCTDMEPCFIERRAQLSKEQEKAYKQLIQRAKTEIGSGVVTAVNAAALLTKITQISCLAGATEVLTDAGWVNITEVTKRHKLWDGIEWVTHDGVVFQGTRPTISFDGLVATEDHRVLTTLGWKTFKEVINDGYASEKSTWPKIRIPYSHQTSGIYRRATKGVMGVSLRLWNYCCSEKPIFERQTKNPFEKLRMSSRKRNSQNGKYQTIQDLGTYDPKVPSSGLQGLQKLRSAWNTGMREMERIVRSLLGGYDPRISRGLNSRAHEQRRGLLPDQLSLGDGEATSKQQKNKHKNKNTPRGADSSRGSRCIWSEEKSRLPKTETRMGLYEGADDSINAVAVYDIINAGPRSRFVIRSPISKRVYLSHNCGVVIGADGNLLECDFGPRLDVLRELIQENDEKVLVFVPFIGVVDALAKKLRKDWGVVTVDGRTPPSKRKPIFDRFRGSKEEHVMVCHPEVMCDGLDMTVASLSIWYAPYTKAAIVQQANARTDGAKQKVKIDIAHIFATKEEKRLYEVVRSKGQLQDVVLELLKNGGK